MTEKKSLLTKVKPNQHPAVDETGLETWLKAEEKIAELIDRVGSLRLDLPSFPPPFRIENYDRLLELVEELNEAHSALEFELIDLKLILNTLLRILGLSEDQLMEVLTHCTTSINKHGKCEVINAQYHQKLKKIKKNAVTAFNERPH